MLNYQKPAWQALEGERKEGFARSAKTERGARGGGSYHPPPPSCALPSVRSSAPDFTHPLPLLAPATQATAKALTKSANLLNEIRLIICGYYFRLDRRLEMEEISNGVALKGLKFRS